jgi:hypothetical protein
VAFGGFICRRPAKRAKLLMPWRYALFFDRFAFAAFASSLAALRIDAHRYFTLHIIPNAAAIP